jgi:hypothetical protein
MESKQGRREDEFEDQPGKEAIRLPSESMLVREEGTNWLSRRC